MAADFADGDRDHGGLVRAIEKTVTSLEGPYVGIWGKSGVVNDVGVYTFIDETKTKNAPGGKPGCEPDLVVVSGHGTAGHLADSSVIGSWRLSEVAAGIAQRLPRVQVVVFAICNTDADKTIAAELRKIFARRRKRPTRTMGTTQTQAPCRTTRRRHQRMREARKHATTYRRARRRHPQ